MRKNIFDIVNESIDMESDTNRIIKMAEVEKIFCVEEYYNYSLIGFVKNYCFADWNNRNHFTDLDDFLKSLKYSNLKSKALHNENALFILIELYYNFWELSNQKFSDEYFDLSWYGNYYHLKDVMDDILEQYNQTAYIDKEKNRVLVIEDKSEVTAVAEIVNEDIALDIIKYNHYSLKGNIDSKKSILLKMGAELEARRKDLHKSNSSLEDDIFFLLNSINLRHNNRSDNLKNYYKKYIAEMNIGVLEEWYDELYQMMLLAFLELDQVERSIRVKELKSKLKE